MLPIGAVMLLMVVMFVVLMFVVKFVKVLAQEEGCIVTLSSAMFEMVEEGGFFLSCG
jgi:hypothetical protein